ncbi:RNA polymerase sigma factor [Melia azedarach]|uniref:RNA polymerase sigma factor n=2 Tax=Melia azedarach TaxID=155640 RepID=A0ACC1X9Z0_MELAZ|nr:RNA polymerase sigma factor [Melia azedarach]KAJ4708140.1 RNA polymerase sigma factor [Melia azedarach]
MGMGFRLNLKWVFPIHSHFFSISPCRFSSASVRGRDGSFNSERLSFLSIISEDSATCFQDPIKAYTCSFVNTQTLESDYLEMEETSQKSISYTGRDVCSTLYYSLLMENLYVLESTFSDSDVLRLEREILLQLGKIGALKLFNNCLSETVKTSNVFDLSDAPTEDIEDHKMNVSVDDHMGKILIPSKRKGRRKMRMARVSEKSNQTSFLSSPSKAMQEGSKQLTVSSPKSALNSKSRRSMLARNEAELSKGVKVVANLERIRTTLEKETGQVVSLKCWAEAAGVSEKVLQQHLGFGWYCRDELLRSTRSLVLFLARNYKGLGIPFSDLLQAGRFGVLQGAERFDHTRGYRFSTYVQFWIRKSMSKMVALNARGIKIPSTLNRAINKIHRARKSLINSHGKYPEDNEIAKYAGLSLAEIRSASECLRIVGSIDQKMGDCLNAKYLEFIPDMSMKSPEEIVMKQHMKKDILNLLNSLDSKERQVLVLRYGLKDYQPKSLEQIGRLFHVSKEWIRKLEKRAMTKLRDNTCKNLSHYLDL